MLISLAAAVLLLALKIAAFGITQSSAILSDAVESVVHLVAVIFATFSLWVASKPADKSHPYGHAKISFFSSTFEGSMIVLAAIYIAWDAFQNLIHQHTPTQLHIGMILTVLVMLINIALGIFLVRISKQSGNVILRANGQHVLTDAWTSAGVILGLALIQFTGWAAWDPIVAIIIAINIFLTGMNLIRKGVDGLMDHADPKMTSHLTQILEKESHKYHIQFHALRFRDIGGTLDVDVDLLFPDEMSIKRAHEIATLIEKVLQNEIIGKAIINTHLEPLRHHAEVHPQSPHSST